MVWESVLFMSWCSVGTFQIIAAWASLKGISFFNHRNLSYVFGAVNIIASFYWFFSTIEIGEGGVKGQHYEQLVTVILGVSSAALITGVVSSIMQNNLKGSATSEDKGIGAFKNKTLCQLIRSRYTKIGRSG